MKKMAKQDICSTTDLCCWATYETSIYRISLLLASYLQLQRFAISYTVPIHCVYCVECIITQASKCI